MVFRIKVTEQICRTESIRIGYAHILTLYESNNRNEENQVSTYLHICLRIKSSFKITLSSKFKYAQEIQIEIFRQIMSQFAFVVKFIKTSSRKF